MTEPSAPSSSSSSSASASASNPPMQPLPEFNRANGFEVTELTEDKKVKKITKFDPNATGAKPSFTIPNNFTVYFHVTAFFKKTQQIFMNQKEDFVEVVLGQSKSYLVIQVLIFFFFLNSKTSQRIRDWIENNAAK
jgi:hypothetical protein